MRFLPLVLLLIAVPVHAQELTWSDAVQRAIANNPDLAAARGTVEARSASYKESYNGILPRVDLTNTYSTSKFDTAATNHWQARAGVSMDIFNQARYAGISSSDSLLEQAEARLQLVSSDILLSLKSAFATLLYTQQLTDVSKTIRDIREKNANLVLLRYDSGRESKGNQLRTRAEMIQAEMDFNQSHRDLEAAQKELNRTIGTPGENYEVAADTLLIDSTAPVKPPFEPIMDNHPDMLIQMTELKNAEASVRQARSTLWPNVSANYSRSLQDRTYFPDDNPNWTASGVLSLPIFGGGLTSSLYSIKAANRTKQSVEEQVRSTRQQVESNLETAWSKYIGAIENRTVQHAFLEAARQRNEEADIRYSNGLMSYDDWERIVTDRVNFERSVISAERDMIINAARWDNARGRRLGE